MHDLPPVSAILKPEIPGARGLWGTPAPVSGTGREVAREMEMSSALAQLTQCVIAFLAAHNQLDLTGICTLFLVFAVTGLIPVPRTALCMAAGAIYGMAAVFVIMPATTLCYWIGFVSARYLFSRPLYHFARRRRRMFAILRAVDAEGWRIVALTRFASVVPTFLQNYIFGLTRIRTLPYLAASFVCTVPQICLNLWIGQLGRNALMHKGGGRLGLALGVIAVLCVGAALALITRRVRAVLGEKVSGIPPL